jgi:hypothetical protein
MGVATAVAIGGLAISAASTAMSFSEASNQKKKQRQAEADAAAAMAEARRKLEINFTDEMAVKKEPYELQREAMLSSGAQAIEAGQESERGAAATAGKVQMAQNEAQADIRTEMGKEMTDIETKQIAEQSRLRDLGVQLDLGEVEGAQAAARDAEQAAAAQTEQAWQGVTSTLQQGLAMVPLFAGGGLKQGKLGKASLSNEQFQKIGNIEGGSMGANAGEGFTNLDLDKVKNMSGSQFRKFKEDLTPSQMASLMDFLK